MLENLYVREMHGWWVVFFAKQANVDWITSRYYLVYIVYVCGCIPIRLFIVKQEMYLQVINRYKTSIWFLFLNQHKYKSFGDNHFFREIYSLSSCDFKEFSAFPSNDTGMGNFHNSQLSLWSLFIIRFVLSMNDLFIFLPQLGSENTLVHYTPGKLSIDFFPWFFSLI